MNFRNKLTQRIGMDDIHEITYLTQGNDKKKHTLGVNLKVLFIKLWHPATSSGMHKN